MKTDTLRLTCWRKFAVPVFILLFQIGTIAAPSADKANLVFNSLPQARFHFSGIVGDRLKANTEHWLLRAPSANPGILEMFRLRDREPRPNLVPWAGEFIGKYLISAIQAIRMDDHPELKPLTAQLIAELIATQAEDGYLGPFPRDIRLKANWDLWGHYHCMLALLLWHESTGDQNALSSCKRAADLVCNTFLESGQRIFDAGSHEMNMAIIHSLGWLYRITSDPRYLQMTKEIEKDWEKSGDYLRTGIAGVEFFQTPRPRWESLHDLQGLAQLYLISGNTDYRTAFIHHWRSILRWDRRNTGGFSSGEQATGDPYAPTAIETCCTIAWKALTTDMLQLTGDAQAADELELSLYNAVLGAQHPSGRWWTYSTPMGGLRESSAHAIVFQARAGTPELNCCSVNGPRGLGMLSEWAVMGSKEGLAINYYGPGNFQGKLPDNTPIGIEIESTYPFSGKVQLRVEPFARREFTLALRIPAWSQTTKVKLNNKPLTNVVAGKYLEISRRWAGGDRIILELDLRLRAVAGDRSTAGLVSIYRGPVLFAYDQKHNEEDLEKIGAIDLQVLSNPKAAVLNQPPRTNPLAPYLFLDLPAKNGKRLRLCDYASAGTYGTRYESWLPASNPPPPPVNTRYPIDGIKIPPGETVFRWTGPRQANEQVSSYQLRISSQPDFSHPLLSVDHIQTNQFILAKEKARELPPNQPLYWKITSSNPNGRADSIAPASVFWIDPDIQQQTTNQSNISAGSNIHAPLDGRAEPKTGKLQKATGYTSGLGRNGESKKSIVTDGKTGMLVYQLGSFPEEDYSLSLWVRIESLPEGRTGQIVSSWSGSMDDPLRLCIDKGKVYARIEAGQAYSTPGVSIEIGRWYHMAVVKSGATLSLYIDGKERGNVAVPLFLRSSGRELALGGNPHYSGNEFLAAAFSELTFLDRALSPKELAALHSSRSVQPGESE